MSNPCFNSQSRKVYVESWASYAEFPLTGNLNTIYIDEGVNALYRWTGSAYEEIGQYPQVETYADLPAAADNTAKIYFVKTGTGIWPLNKSAGFYFSNGTTWQQAPMTAGALTSSDVINNLTSTDTNKPLSANMGKSLQDSKEPNLGYTPENVANKAINFSTINDTLYPSIKAVNDQLTPKLDKNTAIVGATKTKITYDAKGLITSATDATTADISDSTNKRYVSDAQLVVLGNTSGTNTGDSSTNTTSNAYADAKVADAINDGTTTIAPSQNAVFDALALKQTTVLTSGNILVGNVLNLAASVTMSGDATISNTGVVTIGNLKVTNAMIAGNIDNSKLSNNSITINGSAIPLGGSVTTPTYTAGSGLQLIGNTFSVPLGGISLYQINTIGQYSALANLTNTTANAIATDVVDVVGSGAITVSNGQKSVFGVAGSNLTIGIPLGTNTVNGYLSASDRNLFNNKFGDQANQFTALTAKSTLVDSDVLVVEDSAASAYTKKKTLLSDVWTYISTKTGTFTNKIFSDSTTFFGNVSDTTKKLIFSLGGATAAKTLTIASAHTLDRTITLPNATCTLVGRDTTDTLTNKSIDAGQVNSGTLSSARIPTTLSDGNYYITSGGLFVTGYTGNSYGNYQYYKYNANGLWTPSVGNISIEATGAVYTTNEFRVSSDIRIKNIIGETDSLNDLEILNKIKITNYTYKDKTRHGSQIYKKVIAQQIKQVFPQAVSEKSEFIPNIMKMATATDNVVHLDNHGLVDGDYVRLIGAGDKFLDAEVCEVAKDSFGIKLDSERHETLHGGVFVYGVRVDDFLTIDYDALSMLTISALQALNNKFNNL